MKCRKCSSTKIRTRKNYSHGKMSKAIINLTCLACGSSDIDKQEDTRGFRKQRKR